MALTTGTTTSDSTLGPGYPTQGSYSAGIAVQTNQTIGTPINFAPSNSGTLTPPNN